MEYQIEPWRETLALAERPLWKKTLAELGRPFLSIATRGALKPVTLDRLKPDLVLPSKGLIKEQCMRWGLGGRSLSGATLLIQGTGTGWDAALWARFKPGRIIATDLFAFDSWEEVSRHCRDHHGVPVEFRESPLEELPFLGRGSIDVAASFAVLEHCRDLDRVLKEGRRVLKDGGTFYADYGPLWYCAGGDHFSEGEDCFQHLLTGEAEYDARLRAKAREVPLKFQAGLRYHDLGLFSKLTTSQYLEAFERAGIRRRGLILEVSPLALSFREGKPGPWRELAERNPGADPDDFLIKGNYFRGEGA